MKLIIKSVLVFSLCLLIGGMTTPPPSHEKPVPGFQQDQGETKTTQDKQEKLQDTTDEIFPQDDFLFQSLHQKNLPPMTQKEKIIWSFKLARDRIFL